MTRPYFLNMKKLTTISLFIFGVVVAAILTAGLVFYQDNKINNPGPAGSVQENSGGLSPSPGATGNLTLNEQEIAKHNSIGDCWLIIDNKIYNVASYLSAHPGGAGAITPYCGKEASQAFATQGGRGSHSGFATSLLAGYFIGDLNQAVSQQQIQENISNTNAIQAPRGGGEREDEDENDNNDD